MTPRQKRLLDFIRRFVAEHGLSPTYAQMQAELGLSSKSGAHRLVELLVEEGKLVRRPGRVRGIELPGVDLSAVPTSELVAALERRGWRHTAAPERADSPPVLDQHRAHTAGERA